MPIARTLPQSDQGSGFVGSHLQSTGMSFVLDRGGFCHSTTPNGSKSCSLSRPIVAIVGFATGFGTIVVNGPKDQRCLSYWKFGFLCVLGVRPPKQPTNKLIWHVCVFEHSKLSSLCISKPTISRVPKDWVWVGFAKGNFYGLWSLWMDGRI